MSEIRLIDAHAHLNSPQFSDDREAVLERALAEGILPITIGADLESSRQAVDLAERYSGKTFATVGLHPTDSQEEIDWAEFENLAIKKPVVAVGECGLDFIVLRAIWPKKNRGRRSFSRNR